MNGKIDPERWLENYGDLLFRYAMARVGDSGVAEDLVQETLLAAWRNRGSFSGKSSESTWLVGILKHKIADHFRKQSPALLDDLEVDLDRFFDEQGHWREGPRHWMEPGQILEQNQLKNSLRHCIDRLPPHYQRLFYLREVECMSAEEICNQLPATTTNNVWVMLSRMRLQLRQCLERAGFGRS